MRVLLVEDEKISGTEIAATLAAASYVVDLVADGEEGWFRAETEDYKAIILDLGLPRLDGISVLKRLRTKGVATPVLILTARGSWMERVEGIDAGADDFCRSPFMPRSCWLGSARSFAGRLATTLRYSKRDRCESTRGARR
jgi:DNA-binding response OmpR family regulator